MESEYLGDPPELEELRDHIHHAFLDWERESIEAEPFYRIMNWGLLAENISEQFTSAKKLEAFLELLGQKEEVLEKMKNRNINDLFPKNERGLPEPELN